MYHRANTLLVGNGAVSDPQEALGRAERVSCRRHGRSLVPRRARGLPRPVRLARSSGRPARHGAGPRRSSWFASLPDTPAPDVGAFVAARAVPADADLRGSLAGPTETVALWARARRCSRARRPRGGASAWTRQPCTITSHAPACVHPTLDDVVVGLERGAAGPRREALGRPEARGARVRRARRRALARDSAAFGGAAGGAGPTIGASSHCTPGAARGAELAPPHRPPGHVRPRARHGRLRRVALYGCDALVNGSAATERRSPPASGRRFQGVRGEEPKNPKTCRRRRLRRRLRTLWLEGSVRWRRFPQIDALHALVRMGASYGFDLRRPARSARARRSGRTWRSSPR